VFDLSLTKLLFLAVIALVIFGPNELPRIARQAGRALRDLRQIAEGAKADLREGLGPEFQDFDFQDLNPRHFVQKHLFDDTAVTEGAGEPAVGAMAAVTSAASGDAASAGGPASAQLIPNGKAPLNDTPAPEVVVDDRPPFDLEAT
jgi:sec-independent protein translocase protein TatB